MAQVGRISGPLLTANLLRNGVDLAFENDLLYLKVSPERFTVSDPDLSDGNPASGLSAVGINTDSVPYDLTVSGYLRSKDLITNNKVTAGDVEITGTAITSLLGNLNFSASDYVFSDNIRTSGINIDGNIISTVNTNSNLEFRPNGTADFDVRGNVKVNGDVYASGNVTFGDFPKPSVDAGSFLTPIDSIDFGTISVPLVDSPNQYNFGDFSSNISFGDANTDNIVFVADVTSNIIPDQDEVYKLGQNGRIWAGAYPFLLNGQQINIGSIALPNIASPALRPGKTWFVAVNGSDTNVGNHENGPFATISHALSVSTAGDTVWVYPGTYDEVLPLTIPAGVSVTGTDIRTCIIVPDTSSTHEDVFLVNGETTISNLTIKDFFYDSLNNKGHAFRFAPNFKVTSRSPYIQNCTVITKGSLLTTDDPRGFNSADAGRGAYIDGGVANSLSKEASMLFHSCTFITPGVDCITMLNGVRVEWLNGFTYFANKGLYALNGSLGFASQGIKFGAEVRSIGSANIYGTYGAWADGNSTLMYLIMHNFAYIGTGKDATNDNTLYVEANSVTKLNGGKIVYQSTDQKGKFKIGDIFYVDFETGITSIDAAGADLFGGSSINITSGNSSTFIDASKVDTGNLTLRDNDLLSRGGTVNIASAGNEINLTQNVKVSKNMALLGSINLNGSLTFGNQISTDVITVASKIEDDVLPKTNILYSLGTPTRIWKEAVTKNAYFDNVVFTNGKITTSILNSDLILRAPSLGTVYLPRNDAWFEKNLSVQGTTYFNKPLTIVDPVYTIVGNYQHTGTSNRIGNTTITGTIQVTNLTGPAVQFSNIAIDGNRVYTYANNEDFLLKANGLGIVRFPSNNVQINNNLTVLGATQTPTANVSQSVSVDQFTTGNIVIDNNFIKTTALNSNLELRANASGNVYFPSNNTLLEKDLTIFGPSSFKSTRVQGNLELSGQYQHTGNALRTGSTSVSGYLTATVFSQFDNIRINSNIITTTDSNSDLELKANGSGIIRIPVNNVTIVNSLSVGQTVTAPAATLSGKITANQFSTGNILIDDNFITTTTTPNNLRLLANNLGKILVPENSVQLSQNLVVDGILTTLKTTNIGSTGSTSALTHVGNYLQTGNKTQTGTATLTGNLSVTANAFFQNIDIVNNSIRTSDSNSDLELRAVGSGKVYIPYDNVYLSNKLQIVGVSNTARINSSGTIKANAFNTANISISDNSITTASNVNLTIFANGIGSVNFEKVKISDSTLSTDLNADIIITPGSNKIVSINTNTAIKVPVGSNISSTLMGSLRFSTTDGVFSGYSTARRTFGGVYSADRLTYAKAHPTNNTINFVANSVSTLEILTDKMRLNGLLINNNNLINNNVISSNITNADFFLSPQGTGRPVINEIVFAESQLVNQNSTTPITFKSTADGHITFSGSGGLVVPVGSTDQRPLNPEEGDLRFNTDDDALEIFEGTKYIPITGTGNIADAETVEALGDLWALILG